MPMYEYQCSKCEERFEELVANEEDEANVECTGCGSTKVFRVLSAFSVNAGGASQGTAIPPCATGGGCPGGGHGFS